jgi:hypothetical protein
MSQLKTRVPNKENPHMAQLIKLEDGYISLEHIAHIHIADDGRSVVKMAGGHEVPLEKPDTVALTEKLRTLLK